MFVDEFVEDSLVVIAVLIGQISDRRLKEHGNQIKGRQQPNRSIGQRNLDRTDHHGKRTIEYDPQHAKQIGPDSGTEAEHTHQKNTYQSGNLCKEAGFQSTLWIVFQIMILDQVIVPHCKLVNILIIKIHPQRQQNQRDQPVDGIGDLNPAGQDRINDIQRNRLYPHIPMLPNKRKIRACHYIGICRSGRKLGFG